MFSLISGLWQWWTAKTELCILIIGVDNAGKTTTLEQIKRIWPTKKAPAIPLENITPTIGLNLAKVDIDRRITAIFWDLGGQLMLRPIWEKHYNECHGIIFLLDSTDQSRLAEVGEQIKKLLTHPVITQRQNLPVFVLLNKQDAPNALSASATIQELGLGSLAGVPVTLYDPLRDATEVKTLNKKNNTNAVTAIVACSAKTGRNIRPTICTLIASVFSYRD